MRFSPDAVRDALATHPGRRYCVAFSGGLDSTVLLHALAALRGEHELAVRALHVDHGMHPDSALWAEHCIREAAALDVPCLVLKVVVDAAAGGPEAAARDARYAALAVEVGADEAVLTAHHADDQAETVLLALLRGSGPAGLAAMPAAAPLGAGALYRPLLGWSRAALLEWARGQSLAWLDDPANDDAGLARAWLRREVMPALHARWPAAGRAIGRSAALAAEADRLLEGLAALDHDALADGPTLDAEGVLALGSARARNLLRYWLDRRGLPRPPYERLLEAERQLRDAGDDRVPQVEWPGAVVRRWDGRLYAEPPAPAPPAAWESKWDGKKVLQLPVDIGKLTLVTAEDGLDAARLAKAELAVALRRGGERLRLHPGGPHRQLKHLLAEAGVPPWRRERLPLLFADGQLVAAGGLYHDADWGAEPGHPAVRIRVQ